MFKRVYLAFCAVLFVIVLYTAFITFRPITTVYVDDTAKISGVVESVTQGSGGDIHIKLNKDTHNYYINRANQLGYTKQGLENLILNKRVSLCHIKRWTPFTRDKVLPHISRLSLRDSIIFDEIIKDNGKK